MRKSDFQKYHDEFEDWINWYGEFLYQIVEAKRVIRSKYEKIELVEAFVLKLGVAWENLVEEDIITSLNRDSSTYADALDLRLRKHLSRDECRAIVIGHRYLNFRGLSDIKGFAKKYLAPSQNPFKSNPKQLRKKD